MINEYETDAELTTQVGFKLVQTPLRLEWMEKRLEMKPEKGVYPREGYQSHNGNEPEWLQSSAY